MGKELGNLIESAQEGWITKTNLDAAIKGVKKDGLTRNDLKKATDSTELQVNEHFRTKIRTLNKQYTDVSGQIHKILLSDLEKKIKDDIQGKTDAAINKLMYHNHLNSPADIRIYIGSQIDGNKLFWMCTVKQYCPLAG